MSEGNDCISALVYPFPKQQILDLKEFADDSFKFGENGTKLCK